MNGEQQAAGTGGDTAGGNAGGAPSTPSAGDRVRSVLAQATMGGGAKPETVTADTTVVADDSKPDYSKLSEELKLSADEIGKLPASVLAKLSPAKASPDISDFETLAGIGSGRINPESGQTPASPPAGQNQGAVTDDNFGLPADAALDAFKADYPELEKPLLAPLRGMAKALRGLTDRLGGYDRNFHGVAGTVADMMGDSIINDLEGTEELYGRGRKMTKDQRALRGKVKDTAGAILAGAHKQKRPMEISDAVEAAHHIENKKWIADQAEKEAAKKVAKRASTVTQRPNAGASPAAPSDPKSATVRRVQAVLDRAQK